MLSGRPGGHETAPRILIVDDDPNLLVLLADQLRADGFDIQTAREAAGLVKIQWKVLPSITDLEATMAAGAPTPTAKAAMDATERVVMRDRRITPT